MQIKNDRCRAKREKVFALRVLGGEANVHHRLKFIKTNPTTPQRASVDPTLDYCWTRVCNDDPALNHNWVNESRLMGY